MSEKEEVSKLADQAIEIRQLIGSMLGEDKYNLGAVMSALVNILVDTAIDQANMPPERIILIFAQAVDHAVGVNKELLEEERKEAKWLN
jgi:phenylpyruvate tautomerase PptA (4-oxalocrotonate tautomerase family)